MPSSSYADVPRYVLGTAIFSALIALALTAFGGMGLRTNLVYSECIGLLTYAGIDLPRRWLWPQGSPALAPMVAITLVAAPLAWFCGSLLASVILGAPWDPHAGGMTAMLGFLALTAGAGLAGTSFFWARERLAQSERAALESHLKLLQAQIEPHFLFNTLANLQALIAADPVRAQAMLGHLDRYLRATLASTRTALYTLGQEFELLRSYLEILAIRMGPRLAYALDLPAQLADAKLPPMLLQPLVENAIKHGLEPKIDGGSLRVAARSEGAQLVLTVEDSGLGFEAGDTAGGGVGLANVRQRLEAQYAGRALIEAGPAAGGGARLCLRLPLQR